MTDRVGRDGDSPPARRVRAGIRRRSTGREDSREPRCPMVSSTTVVPRRLVGGPWLKFLQSRRRPSRSLRKKFVIPEMVLSLFRKLCFSVAIPPQPEGRCARSSRHARRGAVAAMEPQRVLMDARTKRLGADVKSQRADTPMLVSPRWYAKAHHRVWWPTSPAHQADCV